MRLVLEAKFGDDPGEIELLQDGIGTKLMADFLYFTRAWEVMDCTWRGSFIYLFFNWDWFHIKLT